MSLQARKVVDDQPFCLWLLGEGRPSVILVVDVSFAISDAQKGPSPVPNLIGTSARKATLKIILLQPRPSEERKPYLFIGADSHPVSEGLCADHT